MCFSHRYWKKFLQRKNLNFSSRKSDQKRFTATELASFRLPVDRKMMFYPIDTLLNSDETGINYLETRGRIIVESGKKLFLKIFIKMLCLGTVVRYKLMNEKARVTFSPILVAGSHLIGWKPVVISFKSQFFGHGLFCENVRVSIFWTWSVWRKREIPNFLVRNRVPILGHPV